MMILGWVWLRAVILGGESKIFGWREWWFWHLFQHLFLSFFLSFFFFSFFFFQFSDWLFIWIFIWVWWIWLCCWFSGFDMDVLLMNMGVLLMNLQTLGEGSPVIAWWERFLSTVFLPIWEEKNWWAREENFLLSFPSSLFSFASQTVENTVFHTIFHPLFSILPIIPPTKHSVRAGLSSQTHIFTF